MSHPHILCLPPELLVRIQSFIHPLDILSLRQTCKDLASVTYDREVWLDALLFVCTMHAGFLPAFQMDEMSREALERAALNPYRFASTLLRSQDDTDSVPSLIGKVSPLRDAVVTLKDLGAPEAVRVVDPYFVRGGRFVVVLIDELEAHMRSAHLLDLGCGTGSAIDPVLKASIRSEGGTTFGVVAPGPRTVRVFVSALVTTSLPHILVYEINALSEKPTFDVIARLAFEDLEIGSSDAMVDSWAYSNNSLSFLINGMIIIWDYIANTIAGWEVGSHPYTQISLIDDYVLAFRHAPAYSLWKIPALVPITDFVAGGVVPQKMTHLFPHEPIDWATARMAIIPFVPSWSPLRTLRVAFISKGTPDDILYHFDIQLEGSSPPQAKFLCKAPTVPGLQLSYHGGKPCGDAFVQHWLSGSEEDLMIAVSRDCYDPSKHSNATVQLWKIRGGEEYVQDYDYDSLSARICVTTRTYDFEGQHWTLRILEF